MPVTDIIDAIDALVDEQMAGYRDRSGYDHNVNQDRCWHCGEDWHGLAITARMEEMRRRYRYRGMFAFGERDYAESALDPDYRYAEDDSEVLCPGSDFIGPWARWWQVEVMRTEKYGTLPPGVEWRDPTLEFRRGYWTVEVGGRALRREHGVESAGFTYHLPADIDSVVSAVLPQAAWLSCGAAVDPEAAPEALQRMPATTDRQPGGMRECMVTARIAGRHTALLEALNGRAEEGGLPVTYATGGRIQAPETRQDRALPRPSTTPPMWAVQPNRSPRRRNR